MTEKIKTLHPDPEKQGVNIDRDKYDTIVAATKRLLKEHQPIGFMKLNKIIQEEITDFDGSVGWYFTTVKLDLEARGVIHVDRSSSPQLLTLNE